MHDFTVTLVSRNKIYTVFYVGIFAPSPSLQEPVVEVSTQGDFLTEDIYSTDILPRSRSSVSI